MEGRGKRVTLAPSAQQFPSNFARERESKKKRNDKSHTSEMSFKQRMPFTQTQAQTKTYPSFSIQAGAERTRGETPCHLTPEICKCCQLMPPFSFPNSTKPPQTGPHPFFRGRCCRGGRELVKLSRLSIVNLFIFLTGFTCAAWLPSCHSATVPHTLPPRSSRPFALHQEGAVGQESRGGVAAVRIELDFYAHIICITLFEQRSSIALNFEMPNKSASEMLFFRAIFVYVCT